MSNAYYNVEFQDETSLNCTMKGSELLEKGIFVTGMLDKLDSEIMWLTKSSVDITVKVSFEDAGDNDSIRPDKVALNSLL